MLYRDFGRFVTSKYMQQIAKNRVKAITNLHKQGYPNALILRLIKEYDETHPDSRVAG